MLAMYDEIDNCFIALGAVGLVIECVSKCFTPSYTERKKNHRELISERIVEIKKNFRDKKISSSLEQKLAAIDFHFRVQALSSDSQKEEYEQLCNKLMNTPDDTDTIYSIFNFLVQNKLMNEGEVSYSNIHALMRM